MTVRSNVTLNRRLWIGILAAVVMAVTARAQTAPAGNAHPEGHAVSEAGESLADPFGGAGAPEAARTTPREKHEFSRAVNLDPLRDLAVSHSGRVKILGTLARETVSGLCGRGDFTEWTPATDGQGGATIRYDPLFTLFDLMVDPAYYFDKPLIFVNYWPLRSEFLERAFPTGGSDEAANTSNASEFDRWKRTQRVSPLMMQASASEIYARHGSEPAYLSGFNALEDAFMLWQQCRANLLLVAPDSSEKPWRHVSTLPPDHPVRAALADLGAGWRARDVSRVNAAAERVATELPRVNGAAYPTWKRSAEAAYNRVNAFEWGYWAYLLSLVSLVLAFGTGRAWLRRLGVGLLFGALALHAFGFVSRCLIAERFAIQNQFESMTGLSLFAVTVGTATMLLKKQPIFGAAAAGVGFLVLITATQTGIPGVEIGREAAILNTSVLLKYHVTTVLVSYGLISLGLIVSLFYLGAHYFGQGGGSASVAMAAAALGADPENAAVESPRAKLLSDLDTAQMTVLQLAFWTLGVGILLGAWWADHSWGRWWAFDPKETWALVTWIVYLIVVHVRLVTGQSKGLVTAWLSVAGFLVMLWTYFGVNLLLPGLHAYA